jgi:hypothetical protein
MENVRDVIQPRELENDVDSYWKSMSARDTDDMFSLAYQWQDKPHRHVYNLIAYILWLEAKLGIGLMEEHDPTLRSPTEDELQ